VRIKRGDKKASYNALNDGKMPNAVKERLPSNMGAIVPIVLCC
jgi:hypothetical protein